MDKREFLSALEKSLSVLEENELRDIVSEYEQHIDIKVAKGLTEEEAIADFGSFSELTAELLEAYHVRADYASGGEKKAGGKTPGREREAGEKENAVKTLIRGAGLWIVERVRWISRQVVRPFSWIGKECRIYGGMLKQRKVGRIEEGTGGREKGSRTDDRINDGTDSIWMDGQTETAGDFREEGDWDVERIGAERNGISDRTEARQPGLVRRRKKGKMVIDSIGKGIAGIFRWMTDGACFAARMVWNGCWLLFSVITAGFGLFCLYGLGVLAVLLAQGYPVAGVTLGCLGLVMCAFSASVIGFTFLRRSRKRVSGKRHVKASGGDRKKRAKEEETRGVTEESEGFSGQDQEPGEEQIKRYGERGGEITWADCEV